jgi:hypothetical protein
MNETQEQATPAEMIPSGEELTARRKALGLKQKKLSQLAGPSPTVLSWWENGVRMPSRKHARQILATLGGLERLAEIHGEGFDVNAKVRKIRRQLSQIGSGPKQIPQPNGSRFIREFCSHAKLTPEEFCACSQLATRVADAAIVSGVAQNWIRSWATAMAGILAADKQTFADFATRFATRQAALRAIARSAFDVLLSECGREKIREYVGWLLISGELKKSPLDVEIN